MITKKKLKPKTKKNQIKTKKKYGLKRERTMRYTTQKPINAEINFNSGKAIVESATLNLEIKI